MKKALILYFFALCCFFPVKSSGETENAAFVFSIRPEFASGFTAIGIGTTVEFGVIAKKLLFFTTQISGGYSYFGIEANIGGCFGKDKNVKNVLGSSTGYRNMSYAVDFTKGGEILRTEIGNNIGFGGGFWKIMFGKQNNFDITNKILFGYRNNPVSYGMSSEKISYEKGFDMIYTLGIGYTLTKFKN